VQRINGASRRTTSATSRVSPMTAALVLVRVSADDASQSQHQAMNKRFLRNSLSQCTRRCRSRARPISYVSLCPPDFSSGGTSRIEEHSRASSRVGYRGRAADVSSAQAGEVKEVLSWHEAERAVGVSRATHRSRSRPRSELGSTRRAGRGRAALTTPGGMERNESAIIMHYGVWPAKIESQNQQTTSASDQLMRRW